MQFKGLDVPNKYFATQKKQLHDKWSATVSPWTAINPWLPLSPFIWLRNKGLHYVHRNRAKRRHFSRFFHKILTSKALSKSIHPTLYVHSTLWDSTKKADRLSTYRLFVCLYSTFDSLYYSTDSLTMQCVFFSNISRFSPFIKYDYTSTYSAAF